MKTSWKAATFRFVHNKIVYKIGLWSLANRSQSSSADRSVVGNVSLRVKGRNVSRPVMIDKVLMI